MSVRIDLIYEGIATKKLSDLNSGSVPIRVRIDLIYEGIATPHPVLVELIQEIVRIDLIYEGIATTTL